MLGRALPASLKVVRFENFLPQPEDGPDSKDEGVIVLGLYHLRRDIAALPHLQSCIMQDENYEGEMSEAGEELIATLLRGLGDFEDEDAFFDAHADAYAHLFNSSDADGDSDGDDGGSGDDDGDSGGVEGSSESEEGAGAA